MIFILGVFLFTISAANCGGDIACSCGDNLNESRALNSSDSLTGCANKGLYIVSDNITLDCAGQNITGQYSSPNLDAGIYFNQNVSNITIKGCNINNFSKAIYYSDSDLGFSDITLFNSTLEQEYTESIAIHFTNVDGLNLTDLVLINASIEIDKHPLYDSMISSNVVLKDIVFSDLSGIENDYGLIIYNTQYITIENLSMANVPNAASSIYLGYSNHTTITDTDFTNNEVYAIRGWDCNNVTLTDLDMTNAQNGVLFQDSDEVTLSDINSTNLEGTGTAIAVFTGSNITIQNIYINNCSEGWGFDLRNLNDSTVEDVILNDLAEEGIYFDGANNLHMDNITISNVTENAIFVEEIYNSIFENIHLESINAGMQAGAFEIETMGDNNTFRDISFSDINISQIINFQFMIYDSDPSDQILLDNLTFDEHENEIYIEAGTYKTSDNINLTNQEDNTSVTIGFRATAADINFRYLRFNNTELFFSQDYVATGQDFISVNGSTDLNQSADMAFYSVDCDNEYDIYVYNSEFPQTSASILDNGEVYLSDVSCNYDITKDGINDSIFISVPHFSGYAIQEAEGDGDDDDDDGGRTSGGGCATQWNCTEWSECIGGLQVRTCSYPKGYCKPGYDKPAENQTCAVEPISEGLDGGNASSEEEFTEELPKEDSSMITPILIILIVLAGFVAYYLIRRNNKKKRK